jgi:hypothetical protein
MTHLTDEQIVDATDGVPSGAIDEHLAACPACATKVGDMHARLRVVSAVDVPEPSPLFWEHFGRRVNDAIDAPSPAHRAWRWRWAAVMAAVVVVAVVAMVFAMRSRDSDPQVAGNLPREDAMPGSDSATSEISDIDEDEAWAVVRSLAEDLHYDDAREAGVAPSAGSLDRAATELTEEERAELVRLIRSDLKRAGA